MRAWIATLACLIALRASTAEAQTCHTPSLRDSDEASYRVSVTGIFAAYENASYSGEYQGVLAKASYFHRWFSVDVGVPYYRLVRNGLAGNGLGDLAVDGRVLAYASEDGAVSLGPEVALTLPTGDASKDLGMGHVMLMPGAWLKLQHERLILFAQVAYGRSATSLHMKGHHHETVFPIVNPMNMQEIEHAISIGYAVHSAVQLDARLLGAVPVNAMMGTTREIVAGGARANFGPIDVGLEVQVPVIGAVFRTKTLLSVGAQW